MTLANATNMFYKMPANSRGINESCIHEIRFYKMMRVFENS
jgi:hypothetical protein